MGIAFSVALAVAVGWLALAALCINRARSSRWLRASEIDLGLAAPTVAAIIPARNEADRIGETLRCVLAQRYPHLSILVVDDQSTDATAGVVRLATADAQPRNHAVRLLAGVERPDGWVGKTWALHQGIEATESEWIWMVDADIWLHPAALSTSVELAGRSNADFISLLGRPRCETFWQGSIALALVQILSMLYPLRRVNDPNRPDALAHGAFVLIRRSTYDRVGGISSVRGEIVEDIRFATRVKSEGGRICVMVAPELSQTHMYGSFGDIWRGLRKNAFAGMDYRLHKYLTGGMLGLLMAWAPLMALLVGVFGLGAGRDAAPGPLAWLLVGLAGWLAQAAAAMPVVIFLGLPRAACLTLPAGIAAYVAITTSSVWHYRRGRVLWKDRAFSTRFVRSQATRE